MLKEVDNKINISKELFKKQIFDSTAVLAAMLVVFYFANFRGFEGFNLFAAVIIAFIVLTIIFECSKNMVKRPLDRVVISSFEKTAQQINNFQNKNNSQIENNNVSSAKIEDIQNLIDNLQKFSLSMIDLTNQANDKTNQSLNFTNNEYGAVKTNIEKMFSIRHKIQTIAELILELSDFVQSISSTIGLVEDIAEQTNLLALNAAVEAARAGEHGKGFAVVASEIRKLADESKQATTKIISLINDIQQTANSTVLATEEGTKEIEAGLEHAHIISDNIEQLIGVMNEISSDMKEIIASTQQIDKDSKTADTFIKEMSQIAQQSYLIAKENETIFEEMENASNDLKKSVV